MRRAALFPLLLLLAGCPLQTPAFEAVAVVNLSISATAGAPLVGETTTLTVSAPGGVDLTGATWTTSDAAILALSSSTGATVMATAVKPGLATVTVSAGGVRDAVAITVLASVGDIDLEGPTSLAYGNGATYTAMVTDATGTKISATLTWIASGTVALVNPDANTGASMRIVTTGVGNGAVTAKAGDRTAQIAVKVSATMGQLVITRADGSAIPNTIAGGESLTVEASYEATSEAADDAQWTATGSCKLLGGSGSTLSVQQMGSGACTLTASAKGMQATATFQFVSVTGLMITGDTTPLAIGETRTYTAVGLAGTLQTGAVSVTWSVADGGVLTLQPGASIAKVTGAEVGASQLVASLPGNVTATLDLTVAPAKLQLAAPGTSVPSGGGTTVTVKALDPTGKAALFAGTAGVTLAGATGFATVGAAVLQIDGTVTFALGGATASSPAVTASFGAVTSNPLSFTVATIATVVIMGPQGPVRVGSGVDFTAVPMDSTGAPIGGDLPTTWTDATGVYQFPANASLHVTANAVKLGTSAIVANVMGIASAPFASPAQPGSLSITTFTPASVAVGGTALTVVTILDAGGQPIPNVPPSQVSVAADDATKVSFAAGTVMGMGFAFTATGLAATPAAGVNVTATWTDGMYPVMSTTVPLVVTP